MRHVFRSTNSLLSFFSLKKPKKILTLSLYILLYHVYTHKIFWLGLSAGCGIPLGKSMAISAVLSDLSEMLILFFYILYENTPISPPLYLFHLFGKSIRFDNFFVSFLFPSCSSALLVQTVRTHACVVKRSHLVARCLCCWEGIALQKF